MSSIGWKLTLDERSTLEVPRYKIVYFAKGYFGEPIQSENVHVVIDAIAFSELKARLKGVLSDSYRLIKKAIKDGMRPESFEVEFTVDILGGLVLSATNDDELIEVFNLDELNDYLADTLTANASVPTIGSPFQP